VIRLDAHGRIVARTSPPSSEPVFTTEFGDLALAVIRTVVNGLVRHQVYAVAGGTWVLVGVYLLYVDALSCVQDWKTYVAGGGTVAAWNKAHPHGVAPEALFSLERAV
jgi:hypothetical protein